jgi:acylphosphatase
MVRRRVVVHGRVQGVYFRASCADEAYARNVAGWVRNEPDGSVVAEFEGDADSVKHLIEWCHHGPPRAVVTYVEVTDLDPIGEILFQAR